MVCRCMDVCLCDVIPVAIQGIPLKRVCRCTYLLFLSLSHLATQVFSLEKVGRYAAYYIWPLF